MNRPTGSRGAAPPPQWSHRQTARQDTRTVTGCPPPIMYTPPLTCIGGCIDVDAGEPFPCCCHGHTSFLFSRREKHKPGGARAHIRSTWTLDTEGRPPKRAMEEWHGGIVRWSIRPRRRRTTARNDYQRGSKLVPCSNAPAAQLHQLQQHRTSGHSSAISSKLLLLAPFYAGLWLLLNTPYHRLSEKPVAARSMVPAKNTGGWRMQQPGLPEVCLIYTAASESEAVERTVYRTGQGGGGPGGLPYPLSVLSVGLLAQPSIFPPFRPFVSDLLLLTSSTC